MHGLFAATMQPDQRRLMQEYGAYMITRRASEEEIEWIVDESLKTPAHIAALLAADAALLDYSATVRELDGAVPVLHVIREDWSEVALKWLAKNAPTARTEVFGGHMMFWEFPRRFNRVVTDFLAAI